MLGADNVDFTTMKVPTMGTKIQDLTISSTQTWTAPRTCFLVGKGAVLESVGKAYIQYDGHSIAGDPYNDVGRNDQVAFHILLRKGQTIKFHLEGGGRFQEMALYTVEWA